MVEIGHFSSREKDLAWEFFKKNFEAKYIGPAYFEKKK